MTESPSTLRKALYALASFSLGAWAFAKVNSISGPAFEPIIAACTNPDFASVEEFASKTGYHVYEPKVGLGAFNLLVCLITQFLFELRQTHPAGLITWTGVIIASLPTAVLNVVESGRADVKRFHPVRFPMLVGLLYQLLGVSVIFPLVWVPSYIFGRGKGPISTWRANWIVPMIIPGIILTLFVFTAGTDSYLWTISAGILGGPLLVMSSAVFWKDVSPPSTKENIVSGAAAIQKACRLLIPVGVAIWAIVVVTAFQTYDSFPALWASIWTEANASVAFMTIDSGILWVAILICIAFQDEYKAMKALVLTPIMGPGAAPLLVLAELEEMKVANGGTKDD
uniref:Uncharacterized protein n=1 Tax=Ditylum brightwellii TaxID=49249 RepID=A0A6U3NQB9_9STRA|mmetsp:Transcript_1119/g.1826  ORF Transcript_1119/g.1826 Transcript_1119/m.1826 type:complete len:340 (+) Transcript_1119:60-1079(+)